jgi:alpha-galactosidase
MADEMLVACEEWLPQYAEEIARAKIRLQTPNPKIKLRENYAGAARLHTKTIDEMRGNSAEATKNAAEADKAKKE